jgi:sigma-B regulation protein RsbU (phosphoserine phosphatase)
MLDGVLAPSLQSILFDTFAGHWQKTVGSKLLLLSPEGEVVAGFNGAYPAHNWRAIVEQDTPRHPSSLKTAGQTMLTVPLALDNQLVGYLLALEAREQDLPLLVWGAETIMARLADEKALAGMTDELIGAWNQLALVYHVTQKLALTSDLIPTLKSVLQEIQKVMETEDGFILLQRPDKLECVTCTANIAGYLRDKTLLDNLALAERVVLCPNGPACHHLWPDAPAVVENMLATALPIPTENRAVLGLVNKVKRNFTAGDVKLLAALAQQVGNLIGNLLVHQQRITEERLRRELEIAAEIQESLLPTHLPQVGGLSISVASVPASEVGGDFYDFITLDDRRLTLVIGDVAGKGIPAAMLTSLTRAMLRVEAMRGEPPHVIIRQANKLLYPDLHGADSFVTAFVATIDTFEGTLQYASAGHTPTLIWRAATHEVELLKATSPPLGIKGHDTAETGIATLNAGDTLVFYTDGITEAQSPKGDLFGLDRLLYITKTRGCESPERLQQYIQAEISNFCRHSSSRDDATLLIIKMLSPAGLTTPQNISTTIKTVEFSYPADVKYLADISQQVVSNCRELPNLPSGPNADDFIYLIELAISEICTNIIRHAYGGVQGGQITGAITLLNNGIQLDLHDQGIAFDPNLVPEPKSDPTHLVEGGYGLHIVRQVMDVVSYEHLEGHNHWHLVKLLPPTSMAGG